MHEIMQWEGVELVIRKNTADRATVEWMGTSVFAKSFRSIDVPDHGTVLDIGAHIGSFAVLAASISPCRVIAFEPDRASARLCRVNAMVNDMETRITCHEIAVAGSTGKIKLFESTENWGHTIIPSGGPYNVLTGRTSEVDALSLADALVHYGAERCAFMKFNIEGAEFDMFEKADVEVLRRIDMIVGEIHFDIGARKADGIVNRLADAGFNTKLIPEGEHRAILVARQLTLKSKSRGLWAWLRS
jgi:FkbM family methyltransferase